jgi:hypothetical protein
MRFMVVVKATKSSPPERGTAHRDGGIQRRADKAGVMLAGEGLHPTSKGARVRFEAPTLVSRVKIGPSSSKSAESYFPAV